MKKFLKRANRGLLLGAVILLCLIIYIIIDYVNFSKEKETISNVAENYATGFTAAIVGNDTKTQHELLNTYWHDEPLYTNGRTETMSDIASYLGTSDLSKINTDISDATYTTKSIAVSKNGPGLAVAVMEVEMTFTGKSNVDILGPFGYAYGYFMDSDSDTISTYTFAGDYTVYFKRVDGEWLITDVDGYIEMTDSEVKEQ